MHSCIPKRNYFKFGWMNGETSKMCPPKILFNEPWRSTNPSERINPFPTNTPEGAPFNKPLNSNFSLRVLIHGPLGPAEQGGHPAAQGGGFRAVLGAGILDPLGGGLLGLL